MKKFRDYLFQRGFTDPEESILHLPYYQQIMCGGFAGVIEHLCLFPVDTLKTNMQVGTNNILNTIKQIYTIRSLKGFYRGSFAIIFGCIPADAGYFTTYEYAKLFFRFSDGVEL